MRKFIILLLSVCLIGCSSKEQADNGQLNVYTSFYCIYDLTSKIAGNKAQVTNLIPAGTEPHDWEPTPKDMAALENADVLFCSGLNMEGWLDSVKNSIDVNAVVLTDEAKIENTQDDPHIWLDPMLADKLAQNIQAELSRLDPDNADYYSANYTELSDKLKALDAEYRETLEPYNGEKIVVSHRAYGYLCSAYGLEQVAIDGLGSESEPSPQQMKQIIDTINSEGITTVFYEELMSTKVAEQISEETNVRLLPLNPVENLGTDDTGKEKDYFDIMEENLQNLKAGFK